MAESASNLVGLAVVGKAVLGNSDMPDVSRSPERFKWEGQCWERVSDPDLDVALLRGVNAKAEKEFATRLANIVRVNVKNLFVTDRATMDQAVVRELWANLFTAQKIGTNELSANSVTAGELAANSVTAEKIVASKELWAKVATFGSVTTEMLLAGGAKITGDLLAETVKGITLIGGMLKTSDNPATDGGVLIDAAGGIQGFGKGNSTPTFHLDPATGRISMRERIQLTDNENNGLIIVPQQGTGGAGIFFAEKGGTGRDQTAIWRSSYQTGAREPLNLRGANGGGIRVHSGGILADGNIEAGGALTGASITGQAVIANNSITLNNAPTTSSAANCHLASNPRGVFYRGTSSRRYKKNIVDWNPVPEAVLQLRPRQWQHDDPNFPDDIDERWHVGFVAEEVHDLGLRELVTYTVDDKGNWVPDALNYDRFSAALITVIRRQEKRIAELESKIGA